MRLPATDFSLRANSPVREPQIQAWWEEQAVYSSLAEGGAGVSDREGGGAGGLGGWEGGNAAEMCVFWEGGVRGLGPCGAGAGALKEGVGCC